MEKGADAFRTISEVAEELDLPQHVLRFWETRFAQIKPLKRGGGRRYYRPDDVELLRAIRRLLYGEGYTIKGVQRLLRESGARAVVQMPSAEPSNPIPAAKAAMEADWEADEAAEAPSDWAQPEQHPSERLHADLASLPRGLLKDDIAQLRSALADLDECARILTAARAA
jgi:DNA-binding transcriptional MerR regulator